MSDQLYRVVDDRSFVQFNPETGFTAADIMTEFDPENDPQSARDIIELHSDWGNRMWTPLISTTDSEDHAWKLACNREEYGCTNIHIAIIDHDLLESQVDVYRMMDLVHTTGAEIAPKARSWHEHVCVHHIPIDAVIHFYTLSEFEQYLVGDDSEQENILWSYGEEEERGEEEEQWPFWDNSEEESQIPFEEEDDEGENAVWEEGQLFWEEYEEEQRQDGLWGEEELLSSFWGEEDESLDGDDDEGPFYLVSEW